MTTQPRPATDVETLRAVLRKSREFLEDCIAGDADGPDPDLMSRLADELEALEPEPARTDPEDSGAPAGNRTSAA